MSTYSKQTKHPVTGEWHEATWIDDYYGRHIYGIEFPDGEMFNADRTKLETRDDEPVTNTEKKCCEHYNGTKDITNSCIFCKTYIPRNTDKILRNWEEIRKDLHKPFTEAPLLEAETLSFIQQAEQEIINKIKGMKGRYKGDGLNGRREDIFEMCINEIINLTKEE